MHQHKRLYFLEQLKGAGFLPQELLHLYVAIIRPVLVYCTPVWHYAITPTQAKHVESIQKRVFMLFTRGMSHPNILSVAELTSLESSRDQLSRSFFQDVCQSSSSLYHLLPPLRDTSVLSRLRTATWVHMPYTTQV